MLDWGKKDAIAKAPILFPWKAQSIIFTTHQTRVVKDLREIHKKKKKYVPNRGQKWFAGSQEDKEALWWQVQQQIKDIILITVALQDKPALIRVHNEACVKANRWPTKCDHLR